MSTAFNQDHFLLLTMCLLTCSSTGSLSKTPFLRFQANHLIQLRPSEHTFSHLADTYSQDSWIQIYTDVSATSAVYDGDGDLIRYPDGSEKTTTVLTGKLQSEMYSPAKSRQHAER